MSAAVTSAGATFLLWFLLTVGVFLLVGWGFAWIVRSIIPPHQERFPRHLWVGACLVATLLVGGSSGLNVAVPEAMLAFGDALTARPSPRFTLLTPLPSEQEERGLLPAARRLKTAVGEERGQLRARGFVRYVVGHLLLGQLYEPVLSAKTVGTEYVKAEGDGLVSKQRAIVAWDRSRPELDEIALRNVAGSILVGAVHLGGLLLAGLLMVLLSRRDMRSSVRATARDRGLDLQE